MPTIADRIKELLDFADEKRIVLPLPAHLIVAIEDAGGLVDLESANGDIVGCDGDTYTLTEKAEALCWRCLPVSIETGRRNV